MPEAKPEFQEEVVSIRRVAKVVKGGKRRRFSALVVVGDRRSKVGYALGKAGDVRSAIEKAQSRARKKMWEVSLRGTTIPYPIIGKFGASRILLKPASPGTGVIAGGAARIILEAAGVKDVLTKSLKSSNPINTVYAVGEALKELGKLVQKDQLRKPASQGEILKWPEN